VGHVTLSTSPFWAICLLLACTTPVLPFIQELSYRKQIARQLRRQCAEDIYRPKYYTVTLKYRLRALKVTGYGTIG